MQAVSAHARKACHTKLVAMRSMLKGRNSSSAVQTGRRDEQRHTFSSAAAHALPRRQSRRWPQRLATTVAAGATVAAVGLTIASGGDQAHARALLAAVPRTGGAVAWVGRSFREYSRVVAAHPEKAGEAYEAALEAAHQACSERLLQLCQANGSLYVKAAQFATTVPAVPATYRRALTPLQDQATPQPFEEVDAVLLREFGAGAAELFAEFEHEATAAASLAQVHRARLLSGEEVAVKIQYAGLESAVAADLATFAGLAAVAGRTFPDLQLGWVVEDLGRTIALELDFRQEAANSAALAAATAGNPSVAVPAVHALLSNERVITMEWVTGAKVSDKAALQALGLRPVEVGRLLMRTFAEMAFERGCVHADPHPGNVLVRPCPEPQGRLARWLRGGRSVPPQLVLLDHGSYVRLGEALRAQYAQLWCAFVLNDSAAARQVANEIGGERLATLLPLLLKPGALGKMPKEQRERIQQETGISNMGDVTELIQMMPRPLAQYLRVSAVIRATAAGLGCTIHDRLRVNATAALKGMSVRHAEGQTHFIGDLASRRRRLQLWCRIYLMRWLAWTAQGWQLFAARWQQPSLEPVPG